MEESFECGLKFQTKRLKSAWLSALFVWNVLVVLYFFFYFVFHLLEQNSKLFGEISVHVCAFTGTWWELWLVTPIYL